MAQWPEHSLRGYLIRQPTHKLERIWNGRNTIDTDSILQQDDYKWLECIEIHNSTSSRLCTLPIPTVAFHHSPLLQIEVQKRQLLKKFLSPPYRTKQGGKTKHLLKNLHFLQKVVAGSLLRAATFLTPLSHKMGAKTEMLFENFSKYF